MIDPPPTLTGPTPIGPWWLRPWAVPLVLLALAAVAYAPVRHFGFIRYDDSQLVSNEPHLAAGPTRATLWWAVTSFDQGPWVPLTRLSWLADREWFGLAPGPMHVENVALHAAAAVLLFAWLAEATGSAGRSAAVAAVFVVHPTHVESVAWISERRDVLALSLLMGSVWAYVRYAAPANTNRPGRRWAAYGLALVLYALSLLGKGLGITAPGLLLLLDVWPLGRWRRSPRRSVLDKVPFVLLAVPVAIVSLVAQRSVGAAASLAITPPAVRVSNVLVATVLYVAQAVVPTRLSAMYLPPRAGWDPGQVVAAAAVITAVAGVAFWTRRRRPYVAVGLGWFAVAVAPFIGLTQVGYQVVADRYGYLASIGLLVTAVWAVADAAAGRRAAVGRRLLPALTAAVVVALTVACRVQVGYWRDAKTLFTHTAALTDDNWFAFHVLGNEAVVAGDYRLAMAWYGRDLAANPDDADGYVDLGDCVGLVDPAAAIPLYRQAIARAAGNGRAYANLGNALDATGHPAEAIAAWRRSLALDPQSDYARRPLAAALRGRGTRP